MNEDGVGYKIFRMNEVIDGRMVDDGTMKSIDINAEEFAAYKLNKGDLLFNRTNGSIDQVGKTGMFDLDGDYCFASYLVRIVPGSDIEDQLVSLIPANANGHQQNARGIRHRRAPVTVPEAQA